MRYIHRSASKSHGKLKSSTCLIDSRWTVKISFFGLHCLTSDKTDGDNEIDYSELLWTAPELFALGDNMAPEGTEKCDVYSFGIMLQEILFRNTLFFDGDVSAEGKGIH